MSLFKNIFRPCQFSSSRFCTKSKMKPLVTLTEKLNENLENDLLKPRHHPGIIKPKVLSVPDSIVSAIKNTIKDTPIKQLIADGEKLTRYLQGRHIPKESRDLHKLRKQLLSDVIEPLGYKKMSEIEDDNKGSTRRKIEFQVKKLFFQRVYSWRPIVYDSYQSSVYLIGRSAYEYAIILRIFMEIAGRNPEFKPNSFFDFGSGVGTGTWAASALWKKSLYEYFLVDSSREMNDLSDLILRGGDQNKHMSLKTVYYRQFLPASTDTKYDLVLCAYSLFELPDIKTRLELLLNLWNKCDDYLVIVERGTKAGFTLINEAREFLIDQCKKDNSGHVFSPCPHEASCPRFAKISESNIPCNFESRCYRLPLGDTKKYGEINTELYSYVVMRKGPRNPDDETLKWPRLVERTLIRSKHTICRMCTNRGKLEEVIFTPTKHSKLTYRCAKASDWGDRLPVKIEDRTEEP